MRTSTASPTLDSVPTRRRSSDLVAIVVVAALAAAIGTFLARPPERLPQLTVTNPTPYEVQLSTVRGGDELSPIVIVRPRTSTTATDVAEPGGGPWEVRVMAQGRVVAFTTTRAAVEEAGWELTIPEDVATELRSLGAPPAP